MLVLLKSLNGEVSSLIEEVNIWSDKKTLQTISPKGAERLTRLQEALDRALSILQSMQDKLSEGEPELLLQQPAVWLWVERKIAELRLQDSGIEIVHIYLGKKGLAGERVHQGLITVETHLAGF